MSRQCAPTRMTTIPFCTGALQRQCLRDATRGRCESGARIRRRQGLPHRQGRLHWFRGPVNQQSGTGREVPTENEAPGQDMHQRLQESEVEDVRRATAERRLAQTAKRTRRQSRAKVYERNGLEPLGNQASQNVSGARRVAAPVLRTGQCRHGRKRKNSQGMFREPVTQICFFLSPTHENVPRCVQRSGNETGRMRDVVRALYISTSYFDNETASTKPRGHQLLPGGL